MNFEEFQKKYIEPFEKLEFIFDEKIGYIVWRVGTGENVELLHVRAFEHRKGYATQLIKRMLRKLKDHPPYYSIFGFMLASNEPVKAMYRKLGFNLLEIPGPYKGGPACMMWQSYEELCQNLLVDEEDYQGLRGL